MAIAIFIFSSSSDCFHFFTSFLVTFQCLKYGFSKRTKMFIRGYLLHEVELADDGVCKVSG